MRTDDSGIGRLQRVIRQPHPLRQIAAQIIGHRMAFGGQFEKDRLALIAVQIECQRFLVQVKGVEINTLAFTQKMRPDMPCGIATFWWLDLDNFCS